MAGPVTQILEQLRQGADGAGEELFALLYDELRRLAHREMRHQPKDHMLQPTALVHEAYLRLLGGGGCPWSDRAHFFRAAARAMRTILVDFARAQGARKRGRDHARITFDESLHGAREVPYARVVAIHAALERLEAIDPAMSRVVELRFFAGLDVAETARALGMAERSVYLLWEHARAWLFREINP